MDFFTEKQLINSRNLQYTYYAGPANNVTSTADDPALLLLHGFPHTAQLWAPVIPWLLTLGLRILVPDLLGYGGTSKPWDVSYFASDAMANDIAEILAAENISSVIPIGHDWGSFLAHRYYLYYPEQVEAVVVSSSYYQAPIRDPINITEIVEEREALVGFPLGYYYAFFSSPEAASLLSGNLQSFFAAGGTENDTMKKTFGYKDGLRNWLMGDKRIPLEGFAAEPGFLEDAKAQFGGTGFISPLMWYQAFVNGTHYQVEKDLPERADRVDKPLLHISGSKDALGPGILYETQEARTAIKDLTTAEVESGHFIPLEKPREMTKIITDWLESKKLLRSSSGR
ncbi:hypothetical protein CEP52_015820 [Fusarium oligoseptatum]|uniref:AB hydrolase-1 domain-containing protein n=1 Tax=Fusarium oligoseptatum TaxID=2604345 RepID=A0A428S9N9_9HYPO|nr:hypothetical protein CEP52_015820 [Fusarium oligoseptatum]